MMSASVLGGALTAISTGGNLNSLTDIGSYRCNSNTIAQSLSNSPVNTAFVLEVKAFTSTSRKMQILTAINSEIWYRNFDGDSTWTAWVRTDNYGTSSLSELASALGGQVTAILDTEAGDLNNYTSQGKWYVDGSGHIGDVGNVPQGITSAFYLEVQLVSGARKIQKVVAISTGYIYTRVRQSNGTWLEWKEI